MMADTPQSFDKQLHRCRNNSNKNNVELENERRRCERRSRLSGREYYANWNERRAKRNRPLPQFSVRASVHGPIRDRFALNYSTW